MNVKRLIRLTNMKAMEWHISKDEKLLVSVGSIIAVLQRITGRGCSRTIGCHDETYALTVFGEGEARTKEDFYCPSRYDSSSPEREIMDLYDIVTAGEKRKRPRAHICGCIDFGVGLDGLNDICPACEEARALREKPAALSVQ